MTTMNETQQNLPASKFRRILAYLIDWMGLFLIVALVALDPDGYQNMGLFSFPFILFLYYFFMEAIWDRTLGKLIMGIMVVDAKRVNYKEKRMTKLIFIRTLCRYIPFDPLSFIFMSNASGQASWHDQISGTKVILSKSRSATYFTVATN